MYLVLVRHGESVWNKENKFTGWTDVELTDKGIEEAKSVGRTLKNKNIIFDAAYTSYLKRAQDTLKYIKIELGYEIITKDTYMLNERHYGALQGLNKDETAKKYGEELVHAWRRSYTTRPPELEPNDERFPGNDSKYAKVLRYNLPLSESLKDTYKRVVKYFESDIIEDLKQNKNVLVAAHGNSLRALVKYLENISDEDIVDVSIATGEIYIYEFDESMNLINKEKIKVEHN